MLLSVDQSPAISWVFGRELLMAGVRMPAGIGDVQVYPTHDGVIIELRSGGAAAKLLAHIPDIHEFIDRPWSSCRSAPRWSTTAWISS